MWDDITYSFVNFNGYTLKFENEYVISSHIYNGSDYLPLLGFKLNHVSKKTHGDHSSMLADMITRGLIKK